MSEQVRKLLKAKRGQDSDSPRDIYPTSQYPKDLSKFINKKKYSDIKLVIQRRHVIRAHKIILAKCEFFDAMFSSNMKEKNHKVFFIDDVSFPIMVQLIKFLYTDGCDVTLDNVMNLFKAADIYGIKKLKYICEQTLINNICIENAANTFSEADRHYTDRLRDVSLKYILQNFDPVTKTQGFENLVRHHPDLVIEVLRNRKI
ncbi:unnamed protein product [Moneuplotes crassus]|uniref:BTB domain-containing protein n=1 Tax=Euplotes crassus TaxID=5936 RepID=A0AAD1XZX0_EUPCR|nr:unnamed protein product [Moneuplotes crassus]